MQVYNDVLTYIIFFEEKCISESVNLNRELENVKKMYKNT